MNLPSFCSFLCSFTAVGPFFIIENHFLVKYSSEESSTNQARYYDDCLSLKNKKILDKGIESKCNAELIVLEATTD